MQETKDDKKPESSPRKQSMGERLTEGLQQQQDKEPSGLQADLALLHRKRESDSCVRAVSNKSRAIADGALVQN